MGKCSFNISFAEEPAVFIKKIEGILQTAGGQVDGDAAQGKIIIDTPLGIIRARYETAGQTVEINITAKPVLLSCNTIRNIIKDTLNA